MNPITDHPAGMLQCFKLLLTSTLFFQRSDHLLHYAVLLRAIRRDELLFQPIDSNQSCEAYAVKDRSVIGSKQKRSGYSAQGSVSGDQGLLKADVEKSGTIFTIRKRGCIMKKSKFTEEQIAFALKQLRSCPGRCPSPDDLHFGHPTLDIFFHDHAHKVPLSKIWPGQAISGLSKSCK